MSISVNDVLSMAQDTLEIDGTKYRFNDLNTWHRNGSYKAFTMHEGDRTPDGTWQLIDSELGFELVTSPTIGKGRLFLCIGFVPESVLSNVIPLR